MAFLYDDQTVFFVGTLAIYVIFYWLHALLYTCVIEKLEAFQRYRVQPKQKADPTAVRSAYTHIAIGNAVLFPLGTWIGFKYVIAEGGMNMPSSFTAEILWRGFLRVVVWHVCQDTYFYWSHRAMHSEFMYKKWHRKHHEFKAPTGICAGYAHVVEDLIVNLPNFLIGPVLFPGTFVEWIVYLIARFHETVEAHSGYAMPYSFWRLPLVTWIHGGSQRHDWHHSHSSTWKRAGNFGGFLGWDWLMGTDAVYKEWLKKKTVVDDVSSSYWWKESIPWYPEGIFGPYRSPEIGYSRRELCVDGIVHAAGVALGFVGVGALLTMLVVKRPPKEIVVALVVYCASLLGMLICSATFNSLARSKQHLWALQLADHTGILLLIAGTYCPIMAMACCPRTLGFVWSLAATSFVVKASRSRFDVVAMHVPCFIMMGWAVVSAYSDVMVALTPWAQTMCLFGGVLYTVGLVPWAVNGIEYHNAIWHVFVFAASSCFFAVQILEVAQPDQWGAGTRALAAESGTCLVA